ncbi:hypothetical protein DBR17_14380, partial [Sphingomonas sp. HMWF008]
CTVVDGNHFAGRGAASAPTSEMVPINNRARSFIWLICPPSRTDPLSVFLNDKECQCHFYVNMIFLIFCIMNRIFYFAIENCVRGVLRIKARAGSMLADNAGSRRCDSDCRLCDPTPPGEAKGGS